MPSIKIQRLQERIRQKVAVAINRDVADPRVGMITVTRVELTRDLSLAKIYWSTLAEESERRTIERGLENARGWIQREVAAIMATRTTPHLEWVFDKAIEGIDRVARLLKAARDEDDRRARERGDLVDEEEDTEAADADVECGAGGDSGDAEEDGHVSGADGAAERDAPPLP